MSQLKSVTIKTNAGGSQEIVTQDVSNQEVLEHWNGGSDESISGSLRSNIKGFRKKFSLKWDASRHAGLLRDIQNNIVQDLTSGLPFFYVQFSETESYKVTLDDDTLHKTQYMNQRGLFVPKLSLIGYDLGIEKIDLIADYGFITETVTNTQDYGLITQSVTTTKDYGAI